MGHGIHACMRYQLGRHCLRQGRINDCHIRSNVEVCQRIFDTLLVISDNCKCGNFRCRSGCRRNRTEMSFLTQFREGKRSDQIFKGYIRIFIKCPHGFGCIDRRASAHGNNPVGFEFLHHFGTAHNCFYRRISFHTFEKLNFHAGFLQILFSLSQKSASLHGTAANYNNGFFSFKILQFSQRSFSMI